MVPVVTAILAALLAGAVALYRERRLELQRLLIAARVVESLFTSSGNNLGVVAKAEADYPWSDVARIHGMLDLANIWAQHRDVLAAHLNKAEWDEVAHAVDSYHAVMLVANTAKGSSAGHRNYFARTRDALKAAAATLKPYCDHAGFLRNPGHRASPMAVEAAKASPPEVEAEPEEER
jgi:hypothetical protein